MTKRHFKFLPLLIFFGLILHACNQRELAIGAAARNIAMAPIDGLRSAGNWITGNTYNNYRDQTQQALSQDPRASLELASRSDGPICENRIRQTGDEQLDQLARELAGVEAEVCECEAWGNCTKASCPCETLCPKDFRIFNKTRDQTVPNYANSLSFRNSRENFENTAEMTNGYCWGHAAVTQRFNRVGLFDPTAQPPVEESEDPRAYFEFYKDIIDKVVNNEATEIPGFRNLEELSSEANPAIQEYLTQKVAHVWAREAASFQGLAAALSSRPMGQRRANNLYDDIKERIDLGLNPQFLFTEEGSAFRTHAVIAHAYHDDTPIQGYTTICVQDSNTDPLYNQICANQMILNPEGEVTYASPGWDKIGGMRIAHNENSDTVEQLNSLHQYCQEQRGCD